MESLRELYKIGKGPSSSHTMGPFNAATSFKQEFSAADSFQAVLYGSLAKTGKGHLTDKAIEEGFSPIPVEIKFVYDDIELKHPNTVEFFALKNGAEIGFWQVFSVGGGKIEIKIRPHRMAEGKIEIEESENELSRHREENKAVEDKTYTSLYCENNKKTEIKRNSDIKTVQDIYPLESFSEIKAYCEEKNLQLWEYVEECEGAEIWDYIAKVWLQMKQSINNGLEFDGILPGGLNVQRKAKLLFNQQRVDESAETRQNRLVCSYAFAVNEENANGGLVVTAPTCGASGTLPAVMFYKQNRDRFSDTEIHHALAAAGLIGNLVKTNASISGAECGCQAEVGTACSMAAAGLAQLNGMDLDQIEYAAEIAMEHHLGLTCDPIAGLVQIPCIERNAVAAMRAINAVNLAIFLTHSRKISFDMVVETMYETGKDLFSKYRETSEGGLAKMYEAKI